MGIKPVKFAKYGGLLVLLSSCAGYGFSQGLDLETVSGFLSDVMSHQVAQFTAAFSLAAWIHSGRVKKEIGLQCGNVVASIEKVAQTLQKDLTAQGERIANIETGVVKLSSRVDSLEKQKPKG